MPHWVPILASSRLKGFSVGVIDSQGESGRNNPARCAVKCFGTSDIPWNDGVFLGIRSLLCLDSASVLSATEERNEMGMDETHQEAFELCKQVLTNSPVRGFAMRGLPYRVYTDACDYGLAGIIQQVQLISIKDLKGTRTYERLEKAYKAGEAIPTLVSAIKGIDDVPKQEIGLPTSKILRLTLNEWYAIGHGYYSWQKGTILQQKGKHWP